MTWWLCLREAGLSCRGVKEYKQVGGNRSSSQKRETKRNMQILDGRKQHGTRRPLVGYQLAASPKARGSFQFNGTQSYILGIGGVSQP